MIWFMIIITVCLTIDQITKAIARKFLAPKKSIVVVKDLFSFTFVKNEGGAWGIFYGKMWFFIIITIIALAIFAYLMKDFDIKNNKLYSIGLTLMIAGTIGNFIDRVIFKFVTDFLHFTFIDFPVFNVADICLSIGVTLIIIHLLFFSKSGVVSQ